jgi:HlyD family secretion protein
MKPFSLILIVIFLAGCGDNGRLVHPEVKPLMEAVYASGYVVARDQYNVFAQVDGYVVEKVVEDGANVKLGDPIYIIESGQQSSRFELAQKSYSVARRNVQEGSPVLNEALAAKRLSESKMKHDSVNFSRYENLMKRNATTKAEFDRMRLAYESSRNEFVFQQSHYQRIKDQLYLEFENAKSQLAIAGNESGKYVVRSEVNGKVFRTLKEKSELVRRGESIAILGDSSDYYLQLAIDELDIQRIKTGQQVLVTIDAFPDKIFRAEVEKIYPFVNQQQQSVRADAKLLDDLPGFYAGLAIEANVIIRKNDRALVIPKRAMVTKDTLRIKTEEGIVGVKVKTGIQTLEEIEIVEGIDTHSNVVVK